MTRSTCSLAASIVVALTITLPATRARAQSCVAAPSGIVSWYTLDGTTADRQIANTPSATNAVSFVAGKVGQGATFGSGGFIDIPDSASLELQRITVDAWVRPDGPGPNNDSFGSIITAKANGSLATWNLLWSAATSRFVFFFGNPSTEIINSTHTFPAGSFYHVAGTYDGTTFRLYVNGALEGSFAETKTLTYTSSVWTIGSSDANSRGVGFPRTWNGVIDEVEFLNRALSASEIAGIYNAGAAGKCKTFTCVPAPSGAIAWWTGDGSAADRADGNGGTLQNGATFATGLVGQGFSLDGIDDYVSFVNRPVADLFGSQFTIEFWANPGGTPDRPTWGFLGSSTANQLNPMASYDGFSGSGGLNFGNGVTYQLMAVLPNASANGWTHYAVVADGTNTYRVYVSGTQVNSAAIATRPASAGSRTFAIGQSGFSPLGLEGYFKGILDEFTLYNRGLSQSEVQSIVDAGPAGKCKNTCGNGVLEPGEQCDDGNVVNGDCCSSTCQITNVGSACNDGNTCTYNDTCNASGVCAGTSITCTADQCNTRACNGTSSCTVTPLTGASCNDGAACTYNDTCNGSGVCVGASITCTSDQCNLRSCNGTSSCAVLPFSGVACDDGNPCTSGETCQSGVCGNPTSGVTCTAQDQCHDVGTCDPATGVCSNPTKTNGTPCNDGTACTSGETCQSGSCGSPTSTVSCSALDQCHTAGTCNPATGVCSNPAKPNGTPCSDGTACTSGESCQNGSCGSPTSTVTCPAPDQCHNPGTCDAVTGVCSNPTKPDGTTCNDGSACTTGETCQSGSCGSPTSTVNCSTQDQCHDAGTCDPATGACSNPSKPNGAGCDDGNACTSDESCQNGSCGSPTSTVTCTALDQCHVAGTCDTATGVCSNPTQPNGAGCNDNNACTQTDTCQGGTCSGANPVVCTAVNQCHDVGTCDPATGTCSNPIKPDSTACNDGNACTRVDVCENGTCLGSNPVMCSASDQCHIAGTCNPATGACSNLEKPNGSDCDDGRVCSTDDTCQGGVCTGGAPLDCDDHDPCTNDTCDDAGGCAYTPNTGATCNDGNPCTLNDTCQSGTCVGTPKNCADTNVCNGTEVCDPTSANGTCLPGMNLDCNDHVVCTADSCNMQTGCHNDPVTGCCSSDSQCDDHNACTVGERCEVATGACQAGTARSCDDNDACTADDCDPGTGCTHAPIPGCCNTDVDCDDQDPCTPEDTCDLTMHVCQHTVRVCDDGNPCNGMETCNSTTGACDPGTRLDCDDGVVCTADSCDPETGCHNDSIPNCCRRDSDCDDHDVCSGTDTCDRSTGICQHQAGSDLDCDDHNACTADGCNATSGCTHTPISCDDGNACTSDSCNPASGCQRGPVTGCCNADADCLDQNACNGIERCVDNACVHGQALDCDDGDGCTDDSCDMTRGCLHANNTAPCDDHDACTNGDTCHGDVCVGTPLDCDDHDPCTTDACSNGMCVHTGVSGGACSDGNPCTTGDGCVNGLCRGTQLNCDDGDPCTADACSGGVCVHTPTAGTGCATTTTITSSTTTTTTLASCPAVARTGCQAAAAGGGSFLLRDVTPDAHDKLRWKWTSSAAVATSDFGNPPATSTYLLCAYDPGGRKLAATAPAGGVCAGRDCWRVTKTGFQYADKELTPNGLSKLTLKAGAAGHAKIAARGAGANLHMPGLPIGIPLRVQLGRSDGGPCWETTLTNPTKNEAGEFKSRSD